MALRHCMVVGRRIRIEPGDHDARARKACIEVGMAVGNILASYAGQPDDFPHPKGSGANG